MDIEMTDTRVVGEHLPLSPEQRAVVAAGEAESVHIALVALAGHVDESRMRAALDRLAMHHGSLRHAYGPVPGYRGLRLLADTAPGWQWEEADPDAQADAEHDVAHGVVDRGIAARLASWRAAGPALRAALWRSGTGGALLALAVPALAADGGSLRIMIDDLARGYGATSAWDKETFAYTEYILWRRELDDDEDAPAARGYWTGYMAPHAAWGGPALRQLGASARDGASAVPPAMDMAVDLAADRLSALRDTARRLDLPMPVLLQAAWWAVLGRIAGGWNFLGGWQHDCRRDYDMLSGAVGVYEKILPVVLDWEPGAAFADCASRLADTLGRHIEAQEYWEVDAPPSTAHLEAGFQYVDEASLTEASLQWTVRQMPGPARAFALAMQVGMRADGARLTLAYAPARHPLWAAQALLGQYVALLANVARAPHTPLDKLQVMDEAERQSLLARQGEALDAGPQALPALIARWARDTPEALALRDTREELTYAGLERRVAAAAAGLRRLGVRRGAIVALRLPRDAGLVVAMLAAWRCGAAYLPMEEDWPDARCAAIVRAAMPSCVLVASETLAARAQAWAQGVPLFASARLEVAPDDARPGTPGQGGRVAPADRGDACARGDSDMPTRDDVDSSVLDDVAYVLFTSGSTGEPKGVPIAHRQLLNYVAAATRAMDLGQSRRWALTGTVAADLGNTALFGALSQGSALIVAAQDDMRDGATFAAFLAAHRIDGIKMVPSHLEALLDHEHARVPARVVLGGEASSAALVRRIFALSPRCALYNHYGPTEATVGVMIHPVDAWCGDTPMDEAPIAADGAAGPGYGSTLPLTRVLGNCRVYVLDADLSPTPLGAAGEVYLGGAQLCAGYLGGEGAQAFVADPHRPGERLYRTGDLACVLPDGAIRLAGRVDHQVKIRGHRIEPAEIEARLLALPDIRQAAVIAVPAAGGVALTAFVVDTEMPDAVGIAADGSEPARGGDERIAAWRRALADMLPDVMVPARFLRLPAFPRLANGKIDRQALAARARGHVEQDVGQARPRDALETVVASRMAELLGQPSLGIDDDFFAMGGHSLLVIRLVTRLRKALKLELPPGAVFDHPTAAALAAELRRRAEDPSALARIAESRVALDRMTPRERAALAAGIEERA